MKILNAMTVDVEEHFQVSAFEDVVDRDQWDTLPSRVEDNTSRLLDLFDETEVRATFFVLGWIGERHPGLVRRIAERGHEIASHGYGHRLVYDQTPDAFREETVRSRGILQDASGQSVDGYRAASFSVMKQSLWALDVLVEVGFTYDSSIFPVLHDRYGIPGAPRKLHRARTPQGRTIVEFPPSTMKLGPAILPVGGGGYLRIYPDSVTHWAIGRLNRREAMPAVVYIHPWEVDPEQPRIKASRLSRFRHYSGLKKTASTLRSIMKRYAFGPMRQVIRHTDGFGLVFQEQGRHVTCAGK
jgi:polysaccharide deacetylase family protein (PEP-CTERM system associated)